MKTLRQALQSVQPPGAVNSLKGLAALLGFRGPISLRAVLARATPFVTIHVAPFTLIEQNMALLPMKYGGTEREKAIPILIDNLRREQADVVGLSECWSNDDKFKITQGLKDLYPRALSGPDENDYESNGGLLLLSRYEFIDSHFTIYRQCEDEDCLSNKGVLHGCIGIHGHPTYYDVFLTHMQSCPTEYWAPSSGQGGCWEKLQVWQNAHLSSFVHAYSSSERLSFLLGDLNQRGVLVRDLGGDGPDQGMYDQLLSMLWWPEDAWLRSRSRSPAEDGITHDKASIFTKSDIEKRDFPPRHTEGTRIDYCLYWPGLYEPLIARSEILVWQTSPGIDISDHYGLKVHVSGVGELNVDESQTLKKITITFSGFHCLTETGGPVPVGSQKLGSDEIEFVLRTRTEKGTSEWTRTGMETGIDSGAWRDFSPVIYEFPDPGTGGIDIDIYADEVDEGPFGVETGRARLGPSTLHLSRRELVAMRGGKAVKVPPLLLGDGGEYAVRMTVQVD